MTISSMLLYYFTIYIMLLILLKAYEKNITSKLKINKKNNIIILILSLFFYLNNIFMVPSLRVIFSTLIFFLSFKLIFKEKTSTTIYYTIIVSIVLILCDFILAIILPLGIKNISQLNNHILFKVLLTIASTFMVYLFISNKYSIKYFQILYKNTLTKKDFYIIGIVLIVILNICMFILGNAVSNKMLNIILIISSISIITLTSIIIRDKYETYILKIKEEQLKQNLELYTKVAGEYKELKHNLMNDLLIIKSKLAKKEQSFINDIIHKYKSNYEWVNSITDIPEGLQGLVFLKKHQAELKKIFFNFESNVTKGLNLNNNFKLYEALGIIFDNAIEGASESKEKVISIIFSEEKNKIIIHVMNTFNNSIDLDKIGKKDYSTKNRGSGIGLNYLKKQKNKFIIKQSIRENIFITEININETKKTKRKK